MGCCGDFGRAGSGGKCPLRSVPGRPSTTVSGSGAKRDEVDLSLVSVDSTTARAHHDAAGMHLDDDVLTALEKVAAEEEKARQKGALRKDGTGNQQDPPCRRP